MFTGNAITTGKKSCRSCPGVSVFWFQKFKFQKFPEDCRGKGSLRCLHSLKQHGFWKQNFQVQGALFASNFKEMLSTHFHSLCYILLKIRWLLQNALLLPHCLQIFTNGMGPVLEGGEAGILCCHLPWFFMLSGSHLQESFHRSVPRRPPVGRTQVGGTAAFRCLPACSSHHTISPPSFLSSTAEQKGDL